MNRVKVLSIIILAFTACSCGEMSNPYSGETGLIVLHNYISQDPKGFDTVRASDVLSNSLMGQIYERLFQYSYLERPYKLEPCLADGMYELSDDKLTYTIRIKKGVHYADDPCFEATGGKGKELVAGDFVYAWKRLADANNDPEGFWIFKGYIVGLDDFFKDSQKISQERGKREKELRELYARKVDGIQALDDYTIQFKLTKPYPRLPLVLAMNYTAPVSREAVEYYGKEYLNHPVGTGPFMLQKWDHWHKIVMERNPNFREEYYPSKGEAADAEKNKPSDEERGLLADTGKRLPLADKLVYTIIKQAQPAWLYFLNGYIDLAGIPKDSWSTAMSSLIDLKPEMKDKKIQLCRYLSFSVYYVAFNMNDPLLGYKHPDNAMRDIKEKRTEADKAEKKGNPEKAKKLRAEADALEKELPFLPEKNAKRRTLRHAMSLAYNRPERIRILSNGRATPAQGPIPPEFNFYDEKFKNPYSQFDLEKSKKLLAEAGYPGGIGPDGKQLVLNYETTGTSTTTLQSADFFRQEMKRIGIKIEINQNTWTEFQEKLRKNLAQIYALGWIADYADPENFFQLFYGPNKSPNPNNANYENPEFDRLYKEMADLSNTDPEEKKRKWDLCRRMEKVVTEDAPWIFGQNSISYTLVHSWRRNFKPHAFADNVMKYQTADPALRLKLSREWNKPTLWPAYIALVLFVLFVGMFVYKVRKQSE
ncbi:MAG: hypothetical protein E3J72_22640 [Planctomycetota bacterium]|nr:MAG: hypothetical protein E3J72_22640 [Planctomycetota bacterium]